MENGRADQLESMQGADPDDLTQFADVQFRNAAVTLFFRDHKRATHCATPLTTPTNSSATTRWRVPM